jgi:hypothetical protein
MASPLLHLPRLIPDANGWMLLTTTPKAHGSLLKLYIQFSGTYLGDSTSLLWANRQQVPAAPALIIYFEQASIRLHACNQDVGFTRPGFLVSIPARKLLVLSAEHNDKS